MHALVGSSTGFREGRDRHPRSFYGSCCSPCRPESAAPHCRVAVDGNTKGTTPPLGVGERAASRLLSGSILSVVADDAEVASRLPRHRSHLREVFDSMLS